MLVEKYDDENLKFSFKYEERISTLVKQLPSRTPMIKEKAWKFPVIDLFILKKIFKENGLSFQVTDEARKTYVALMDELKSYKALAEKTDIEHEILGLRPDVKLYPFQSVGSKFLDTVTSGLMGMDMGLGKTITAISHVSNQLHRKTAKRILVICPASVKIEWAYQLAKFSKYSYTVVDGPDRESQYTKNTDFIIMNYDLLWRDIDFLETLEFDVVIADEIQRAKNHETGTAKAMERLKCDRRIGLTGTPLENDIMDLWTIMKFINPKIFGTDETTFKFRYCQVNSYKQIIPGKYRNLDEINRKLSFTMFRRIKRDVLDNLPEKITNNFYVPLNDEERKIYEEVKSGILEDLEAGKVKMVHALAMITYLRQVCNCLNTVITKKKIVSSKLVELQQILKGLPTGEKVVIFSQYAKMGEILQKELKYKSVFLHGGVKQGCRYEKEVEKAIRKDTKLEDGPELDIQVHEAKQEAAACVNCPYYNDSEKCSTRKKIMAQFNDPEEGVRLFISTDAGKSGLNLQVASTIINYDLSFNPATNEQRIARIDRIGQEKEKILVLNLIAADTIENRVLSILSRKQKLFDQVIDNLSEAAMERLVLNHKSIKDLL